MYCKPRKVAISIISAITLGLCCALFITAAILIHDKSFDHSSKTALVIMITLSIIFGCGIAWSIYTAYCGRMVAHIILAVVFILLDALILASGIWMICYRSTIIDSFEDLFHDLTRNQTKQNIQNKYQCCGFVDPIDVSDFCGNGTSRCQAIISNDVNMLCFSIGIIALVFFVTLLIGIVMSFVEAHAIKEDDIQENSEMENRYALPMAYGF